MKDNSLQQRYYLPVSYQHLRLQISKTNIHGIEISNNFSTSQYCKKTVSSRIRFLEAMTSCLIAVYSFFVQIIITYDHIKQQALVLVCSTYGEKCTFRPNVDWVMH